MRGRSRGHDFVRENIPETMTWAALKDRLNDCSLLIVNRYRAAPTGHAGDKFGQFRVP